MASSIAPGIASGIASGVTSLEEQLDYLDGLDDRFYVAIETSIHEGNFQFPFDTKTLPRNFFEHISPDGYMRDHREIEKLIDIREYGIFVENIISVRFFENVLPKLSSNLSKLLDNRRTELELLIYQRNFEIEKDRFWRLKCSTNPKLLCEECHDIIYEDENKYQTSEVQFKICYKCANSPTDKVCSVDGCEHKVYRNMGTLKFFQMCKSCYVQKNIKKK